MSKSRHKHFLIEQIAPSEAFLAKILAIDIYQHHDLQHTLSKIPSKLEVAPLYAKCGLDWSGYPLDCYDY